MSRKATQGSPERAAVILRVRARRSWAERVLLAIASLGRRRHRLPAAGRRIGRRRASGTEGGGRLRRKHDQRRSPLRETLSPQQVRGLQMAKLYELGKFGVREGSVLLAIASQIPLMLRRRRWHDSHSSIGLPSATERLPISFPVSGVCSSGIRSFSWVPVSGVPRDLSASGLPGLGGPQFQGRDPPASIAEVPGG